MGIDAKDGEVAVHGWVDPAEASALDLAKAVAGMGVATIIYTDISRDGMLVGPNFDAQAEMCASVPCNVIASGGVGKREDIVRFAQLAKSYGNLDGVIIGMALYEGKVELPDVLAVAEQ